MLSLILAVSCFVLFNSFNAADIYNELTDYKILAIEANEGITKSFDNIGISHAMQGNFDKAIEFFLKSLEIFTELSESSKKDIIAFGKQGMAQSFNKLGIVYWNLGDYDNASVYYSESLEIVLELNDTIGIFNCTTTWVFCIETRTNMAKPLNIIIKRYR